MRVMTKGGIECHLKRSNIAKQITLGSAEMKERVSGINFLLKFQCRRVPIHEIVESM